MWYVKILIIDIILYIWFLLLNSFFCKTLKLNVVLRIRERAMATVQNPITMFSSIDVYLNMNQRSTTRKCFKSGIPWPTFLACYIRCSWINNT
jgi:hypothetical protein